MTGIDTQPILEEFDEAQRDAARRLLDWLAADWEREAARSSSPDAVRGFQREDLDARLGGTRGDARLEALRVHVLARKIDQLGGRTFALGKAVLAGTVADDEARQRGEELRQEVDSLGAELRTLPASPELEPLRRELSDAAMETLYAIERKAMSPRLARENGQDDGPPLTH